MKRIKYIAAIFLAFAITTQSCKEELVFKELTWKEGTTFSIEQGETRNFVVSYDEEGLPVEMVVDEIDLNMELTWEDDVNPVSKVTLYIQLQEDIDGVKKSYGLDSEIEAATITDFGEEGKFTVNLKSDDVYTLFVAAFAGSRDQYNTLALPNDIFEITWKITGVDGTIADTRNECFGGGCQYGFSTVGESAKVNWWNGTFDYVWLEASDDVIYYGYGAIEIGTEGSIDIIANGNEGESDVSHTMFGYYYGVGEALGLLTFNEATGGATLTGDMEEAWIISNINGSSLDIDWSYQWAAEYGKVRLTRRDGKDWPTNINTPLGEAPEDEVWNGTYTFEYLEVGPGVAAYSYYDEIFVGYTGTVDCATEGGIPSVSHGAFDYWFAAPWEVTLTYDYSSGLVAIATPAGFTWEISNVTDRTIDIHYDFHSGYEEYATVRLTRSGSYDWPSNLNTE